MGSTYRWIFFNAYYKCICCFFMTSLIQFLFSSSLNCKNIIYYTYINCVSWLFMLVIKFGRIQKLYADFQICRGEHPFVVQESTIFPNPISKTALLWCVWTRRRTCLGVCLYKAHLINVALSSEQFNCNQKSILSHPKPIHIPLTK